VLSLSLRDSSAHTTFFRPAGGGIYAPAPDDEGHRSPQAADIHSPIRGFVGIAAITPILRELILTVTFRAAANLSSGDPGWPQFFA
jgi:hypothetical protein